MPYRTASAGCHHHDRSAASMPAVVLVLLGLAGTVPPGVLRADEAGNGEAAKEFRDTVYPLLVTKCGSCHGGKQQEGRLRLDARGWAFAGGVSGPAVVAGDSARSVLLQRVLGEGDLDRMPLEADPLTAEEVAAIRRWIDAGAIWPKGIGPEAAPPATHWAFQPPQKLPVPAVEREEWPRNVIDRFVLARMEQAGVAPSPRAGRETLLRRASLHLIGLPPTPAQIDAFLADDQPGAFERVVDRLLASPRYGERWAIPWLDAARYADSNGYQRDGRRSAWPWRDWVVDALNADMPFDRFTIEQLAGDLLPEATLAQQVATGFHRNTMANVEAGTDPEEEHALAILDRVNTTGTVWLGLTLECASCHNHKYDPISQREYYRLYAFFGGTEKEISTKGTERDFAGPKLTLPLTSRRQTRREKLLAIKTALEQQGAELLAQLDMQQRNWEQNVRLGNLPPDAVPDDILQIVLQPVETRTAAAKKKLAAHFRGGSSELKRHNAQVEQVTKSLNKLAPATTLVMRELPGARMANVFRRGDFLDPGEQVTAGTPAVLPAFPEQASRTRLGLARWLVDPAHPLVPRVIVNRQWAALFGRGLVRTPEDFGTRGERPTHPELLDWLAREFVDSGWSLKRLHRLLVLSATWQQSSHVRPELREQDPENRLYARSGRLRLPAELIRDNLLAVSGLLSGRMHGPPVFPRQPAGVWNHIGRASNHWATSSGTELWRRGLYVYWRRTVPYPGFVSFDAPTREQCSVTRSQSITPLQALNLLNDPVAVEAAVALAARLLKDLPAEASDAERVRYGFRLATGRRPSSREEAILLHRCHAERDIVARNPDIARELVADYRPVLAGLKAEQIAPWVHLATVLLNLDETITRN